LFVHHVLAFEFQVGDLKNIWLVCAPCRHVKMVASSLPPLTDVMTERPCELLHMDLVGPTRVRSAGGKGMS
jgi:hypothetical protein